jgi:ArsR family transcriptional regulator
MSIPVYMMAITTPDPMLPRRLERLTGNEAPNCVPLYLDRAKAVRGSPEFAERLQRVRALSDPNRLLAVLLLERQGELCACEVQAATGLSHATVSHHMKLLVKAGIVSEDRRGKWRYYRLRDRSRLP